MQEGCVHEKTKGWIFLMNKFEISEGRLIDSVHEDFESSYES